MTFRNLPRRFYACRSTLLSLVFALSKATRQPLNKVKQVIGEWVMVNHGKDVKSVTMVPFDDSNAAWQHLVRNQMFPAAKKDRVATTERKVFALSPLMSVFARLRVGLWR